nr:MAG TPA: hypothetical protein [Caudoviricetes sp.]
MRKELPPRPKEPVPPPQDNILSSSGPSEEEIDLGLTEEEKTYLSLKWGSAYNQSEWVKLE